MRTVIQTIRLVGAILAATIMASVLPACSSARSLVATFRSTDAFVALGSDPRILYEPGAEALADWPNEQTVGTHIDVSHIAPTPVGFEVTAKAKLIEVDGRRLLFEVEAHDSVELISKGKLERFIINKMKFDSKMKEKISKKIT